MPPPPDIGAGRMPGCRDGFYLWPTGYVCFQGEDSKLVTITVIAFLAIVAVITCGVVAWSVSQCGKCAKEQRRKPIALQQAATQADTTTTEHEIIEVIDICEIYPDSCKDGEEDERETGEREADPPLYEDVSEYPELVAEPEYTEPTTDLIGGNEQLIINSKRQADLRNPDHLEVRWKFRIREKGGAVGPWRGPYNAAPDRHRR